MTEQTERLAPHVIDGQHAPFIFFDAVSNLGSHDGVVVITLTASRPLPDSTGGLTADSVVVAHLRCSERAARELQKAVDNAFLLGMDASGTG